LVILVTTKNNAVKYFACFLVLLGIFPNVPQITSWNSNNIGGSVKRGVGVAMQIGCVRTILGEMMIGANML
jgi:hypothetical protein